MSPRAWCFALLVLSVVLYGGVISAVIGMRHMRDALARGALFLQHVGSVAP